MTAISTYSEPWTQEYLDWNESRAEREIAVDKSGILAWGEAVKVASRPNSGLRVKYSPATAQYTPIRDAMGSGLAEIDGHETVEQDELPDGVWLMVAQRLAVGPSIWPVS